MRLIILYFVQTINASRTHAIRLMYRFIYPRCDTLSPPFLPFSSWQTRASPTLVETRRYGTSLYSSLIFNAHPFSGVLALGRSVAGKRITYFDRPCSPRNSTITRFDARGRMVAVAAEGKQIERERGEGAGGGDVTIMR